MRCIGCNNYSERLFCNRKCFDLFIESGKTNRKHRSMPAACRLCPFRREKPWASTADIVRLQACLQHNIQTDCMTGLHHCGLRRQCYGYKLAMSGGNAEVYSREEFLRDTYACDNNTVSFMTYIERFMGYRPTYLIMNYSGKIVWLEGPDHGQQVTNIDGVPLLGHGIEFMEQEDWIYVINKAIEGFRMLEKIEHIAGAKS